MQHLTVKTGKDLLQVNLDFDHNISALFALSPLSPSSAISPNDDSELLSPVFYPTRKGSLLTPNVSPSIPSGPTLPLRRSSYTILPAEIPKVTPRKQSMTTPGTPTGPTLPLRRSSFAIVPQNGPTGRKEDPSRSLKNSKKSKFDSDTKILPVPPRLSSVSSDSMSSRSSGASTNRGSYDSLYDQYSQPAIPERRYKPGVASAEKYCFPAVESEFRERVKVRNYNPMFGLGMITPNRGDPEESVQKKKMTLSNPYPTVAAEQNLNRIIFQDRYSSLVINSVSPTCSYSIECKDSSKAVRAVRIQLQEQEKLRY
jgi:hypothetical protein